MARSRRRTPIIGNTTAESDKWAKVLAHRAYRRAARVALVADRDPPAPKLFGSPWSTPKDGKHWLGRWFPELLRK